MQRKEKASLPDTRFNTNIVKALYRRAKHDYVFKLIPQERRISLFTQFSIGWYKDVNIMAL